MYKTIFLCSFSFLSEFQALRLLPAKFNSFCVAKKIFREKILMHTFDIFIEIEGRRDRNRKMKVPK
jgi:hypothetical protein